MNDRYEDWYRAMLLEAGCRGGSAAFSLALQLANAKPCPSCRYVHNHCRCNPRYSNETTLLRPAHMNVTADQVRSAMIAADLLFITHHECSLCEVPVGYQRVGGKLFFNSTCDCCSPADLKPREWQEVADWINEQPTPKTQRALAQRFGLGGV